MATKTYTVLYDDIDGNSEGDVQTVDFTFAGKSYEIDLSENHRDEFTGVMKMFVDAARPAGKSPAVRNSSTTRAPTATTDPGQAAEIRTWARDNDVQVPPRGRIPKTVIAQYESATSTS